MSTKTKVHDVRIIETEGWDGLYIDGRMEWEGPQISPDDITRFVEDRTVTIKSYWMVMSDKDRSKPYRFPRDISELDKREDDFRPDRNACSS